MDHMTPVHDDLAAGRWRTLSLSEQLGNVGSEVSRALRAREQHSVRFEPAFHRALELLDLTISDPRHRGRLRELCRMREVLCDFLVEENEYHSTADSLDRYFLAFAKSARKA